MSEKHTRGEVAAILGQIIADHPDRVIRLCRYRTAAGRPWCLIGHLFDRLGLLDELVPGNPEPEAAQIARFRYWHNGLPVYLPGDRTWDRAARGGRPHDFVLMLAAHFTVGALQLMKAVQIEQDLGRPWSDCGDVITRVAS